MVGSCAEGEDIGTHGNIIGDNYFGPTSTTYESKFLYYIQNVLINWDAIVTPSPFTCMLSILPHKNSILFFGYIYNLVIDLLS